MGNQPRGSSGDNLIFQSLNPQQMATYSQGLHNRTSSGYNNNVQKNIEFMGHQKTQSKKIDKKKADYMTGFNKQGQ